MAAPPPMIIAHLLLARGKDAAAIPITMALSPLRAKSMRVMLRKRRTKSHVKKSNILITPGISIQYFAACLHDGNKATWLHSFSTPLLRLIRVQVDNMISRCASGYYYDLLPDHKYFIRTSSQ
jgi:hypothetical protein